MLNLRRSLFLPLLLTLVIARPLVAEVDRSGEWTVRATDDPQRVEFSLSSGSRGHSFQFRSTVPVAILSGLDLSLAGRRDVRFEIDRDAGRFECEGFVRDGRGAGTFDFYPDPSFAPAMRALGFEVREKDHFGMALHDVSVEFAARMRDLDLRNLDSSKLIAFRVHGVSEPYVEELRAAGQSIDDSDQLIAFRVHGVRPDFVRALRSSGYEPSDNDVVALRVHGASIDWVGELARRGYDRVSLRQLIAFRVHDVSPEFIDDVEALGFSRPDPEKLIAMRVHGVTPEFISEMHSRGLDHLTIDQLVGMKIHGLD